MRNTELEKSYDAAKYEADIYKMWMSGGYFNPDKVNPDGEPFSIVLPPPNVTGTLHIGHAIMVVIQDILIRWRRMQGRKVLWVPGTDHAAIATQSKVEKILAKEGIKKADLGREGFLKRVNEFAQNSHDTIINQLKSLGASLDWSREAYTLDETRSLAVRTAFKAMYDDGLIYRAHKVVNWDPKGQTVISDDEVVHQERDAVLYTFKYAPNFPIPISSTRPETKVGDTAVAVHPSDERYKEFVGKEYDVNFCGVDIHLKVIADESVEPEFGTGALGVTPAHSMIDSEIAERHNLPFKPVINEYAKMSVGGPELLGKKASEAKLIVVDWLRANNLLIKEEKVKQAVATAERSGGIIEPLPKMQWFLAVNKEFNIKYSELDGIKIGQKVTLKQLMQTAVRSKQINIVPEHFNKTYFHWIDNLRDWCISRQLWFGHRIPVWYKDEEVYCGVDAPSGRGWEQDEDTLDTWFSAGLWTFTTLGWPKETKDLAEFHPTDVLETGYDILFFWVARMVLMSTYHTGQIPFKNVFLHGLVRDAQNRKMSKSLDNIIDPLDMTAKYGTDALRFSLIFNTAPGTDMALSEDKIKGMKHFGNKIWNIARFVLANSEYTTESFEIRTEADKVIMEQLLQTIDSVDTHLENFRLHEAAQTLYDFVWKDFADVYIEASKLQLQDEKLKDNTQGLLLHILIDSLKLLHPFMPFLTETLWINLGQPKVLITTEWPK